MKHTQHTLVRFFTICLTAAIVLFSLGTSLVAAAAQGVISGTVTDSNNKPVAGVFVFATGTGSVTTDSTGKYTITGLNSGPYTVTAQKTGYNNAQQTNVVVTDGQTTTVNLQLTPPGTITGKITNSKNEPISGATVTAYGVGSIPPVTSNASGNYTLSNLNAGSYTVQIYAPGYPPTQKTNILVTSGQTVTVDFQLTAPGTLSGVVSDANNAPISGANVSVAPYGSANTNALGKYTISNLNGGSYTVTVSKAGYSTVQYNIEVIGGQTTTLNVQLAPLGSISVNVTDTNHAPIGSASVAVIQSGITQVAGLTTAAGNFTALKRLNAGTYSLVVSKAGFATTQQDNVIIIAGQTTTVNVQLAPPVSTTPLSDVITVTNNIAPVPDNVTVTGLVSGDIIKVYDLATGGNLLGQSSPVASGQTSATVSILQLGLNAGQVYVSVTSAAKLESNRTAKAYDAEPVQSTAPAESNITVTNNPTGTLDTVLVNGLTAGDLIKVYGSTLGGNLLSTATVPNGQTSVIASVYQLGTTAGQVYISATSIGKTESTLTAKAYDAEPIVDTVAPITKYHFDPIYDKTSTGKQYIKGYTTTLRATDNVSGSGVKTTQYRINGGTWITYTAPFTFYAGVTHTVEYFSTDDAGNVENPINLMDFDKGKFTGAGKF